jgi:hypothetical protein
MGRSKATPVKRAAHRFEEEEAAEQVKTADDVAILDYGLGGLPDENEGEVELEDAQSVNNDKEMTRSHVAEDLFGIWRIVLNEIEENRSFALSSRSTELECNNEVLITYHRIAVHIYPSALEELKAVANVGLFCQGQYLVIEDNEGPSLDGFSCRALFSISFLRALHRDLNGGALRIAINSFDKEGITLFMVILKAPPFKSL